jgi:hypothetical protein
VLYAAHRIYDGNSRWARFSAPTTKKVGSYQFTPNQTTALYPQLASAKPLATSSAVFDKVHNAHPARA